MRQMNALADIQGERQAEMRRVARLEHELRSRLPGSPEVRAALRRRLAVALAAALLIALAVALAAAAAAAAGGGGGAGFHLVM